MKKTILVIAPHPDDEMIGVGGTILKDVAMGNDVYICIVTKGVEPLFSKECIENTRAELKECHKQVGIKETFFLDFPSVMLEKCNRYEINNALLKVIQTVNPEEVYIPHWGDMQKDHQIVTDASMVTLRPKYKLNVKRILAYETLSETGWNIPNVQNEFIPNVYIDISQYLELKLQSLQKYQSQLADFPAARSIKAIESLALYRGALMNVPAAEAFVLIREIR